jgi:MoaA/NifB/PqqE/SkfB family radical SAM enzyme
MRFLTVMINERCPLKCRHCSVGFSETNKGSGFRIAPEDLVHIITSIDKESYQAVLFAGGEPSLDPALVKLGIDTCRNAGLDAAIVTAPIWASTEASAKRFLDKVEGLSQLMLSYDYYHLEFLKYSQYENAAREAAARGLFVVLHITYSQEEEKQALIDSVASIRSLVYIDPMRTVPVGNAAEPGLVELDYVTINSVKDLDALPRRCVLGNTLVDARLDIHGCCWSNLGEASPFSIYGKGRRLDVAFKEMEESPTFQAVRKQGFLNSLSPRGREALVEQVKGQQFCNECHICIAAMKKGSDEIWNSYLPVQEISQV